MNIPDWIWWAAYTLVGVHLIFQIRRVLRGSEVQVPAFYHLFGVTVGGIGAHLMIIVAVLLYLLMGIFFYLRLG